MAAAPDSQPPTFLTLGPAGRERGEDLGDGQAVLCGLPPLFQSGA